MRKNILNLACTVALYLFFIGIGFGQKYNFNSPAPLDAKVKTGTLDNGMRYYIRANKNPEKRADFYIVHNVGAIQENDDQNGLAHFTEHMAFNGTKNFPKKGILNFCEGIGVKFGTNINANTGVERTMYLITNVPLLREGITDTALLILHDWSNYISFEDAEVDAERGVIREEWRVYGSADERMDIKLMPTIYKDSKYAKRNVIGDTAVINHFKYQTIKDFYHKWYRTDLQGIVVVGDFDENVMEAKIKKLFNTIPKPQNITAKEEYPLPNNKEALIGLATDKEATETVVNVFFKHEPVKDNMKNLGYLRAQLVRNIINSMFAQRMMELSRKENPPFMMAFSYYGQFTRAKDAFIGIAQAPNNQGLKALGALLIEMQRMKLYGFITSEFERAKIEMLRRYESQNIDRDKRKNRELVRQIISNFSSNEPNPGVEYMYQFAKDMMPEITLDEINKEAKNYVTDENCIVTITGPEQQGVTLPTEQEIRNLLNTYKSAKIEPYVDNLSGKKLVDKEIKSGKVESITTNKVLGTTEWTLSNKMKIVFKPTEFKDDELLIQGYSNGGSSLLKDAEMPSANFFGEVVNQMGVGDFSVTDLVKMTAGKQVSVGLGLSGDQQTVNARTSPKDLETAMQLIYLYFTNPRWNEIDYKTWLDKQKATYINADAEPRKAFSDTLTAMLYNHHPRIRTKSYKLLDEISLEKMKAIYKDRFADAGSFTFQFVGKVNPDEIKPLIEKYLASLPTISRKEVYKDNNVRQPKGKVTNDFLRENKTPRTSVFVNYNGTCGYTIDDRLMSATLRHILELRYTESIREKEGGTYGVSLRFTVNKYPVPTFLFNISFDTDPQKADKLLTIVDAEIKTIVENGPTEVDLQKAKEYFGKQRQEDMKENNWWSYILSDYYFNGLDYLTEYDAKVKALTVKLVHEYAKKVLTQGNVIKVVMRPK